MHLAKVSATEASSEGKDSVRVQGDQQTRKTWTGLSQCGWSAVEFRSSWRAQLSSIWGPRVSGQSLWVNFVGEA